MLWGVCDASKKLCLQTRQGWTLFCAGFNSCPNSYSIESSLEKSIAQTRAQTLNNLTLSLESLEGLGENEARSSHGGGWKWKIWIWWLWKWFAWWARKHAVKDGVGIVLTVKMHLLNPVVSALITSVLVGQGCSVADFTFVRLLVGQSLYDSYSGGVVE